MLFRWRPRFFSGSIGNRAIRTATPGSAAAGRVNSEATSRVKTEATSRVKTEATSRSDAR
jgi:hypothetical protein